MSQTDFVAQDKDFFWKSADTLPSDGFVLARIEHCQNPRRAKLVFARSIEDGVLLGDGSELSYDWSVTGWVGTDIEVNIGPQAALQADFAPLEWEQFDTGSWCAPDGMNGLYTYSDTSRFVSFEQDVSLVLSAEGDPRKVAQDHLAERLRGHLINQSKRSTTEG